MLHFYWLSCVQVLHSHGYSSESRGKKAPALFFHRGYLITHVEMLPQSMNLREQCAGAFLLLQGLLSYIQHLFKLLEISTLLYYLYCVLSQN